MAVLCHQRALECSFFPWPLIVCPLGLSLPLSQEQPERPEYGGFCASDPALRGTQVYLRLGPGRASTDLDIQYRGPTCSGLCFSCLLRNRQLGGLKIGIALVRINFESLAYSQIRIIQHCPKHIK